MPTGPLADLFPGFESHSVPLSGGTLFCRTGGTGPALLLLHGYPQSHVMWHKIAGPLADHFTLYLADLPGYGQSGIPPLSDDHQAYSKRAMAKAMVELMHHFGHDAFFVAGHDRGGRVAYRMALDFPDTVRRVAVLDILPTYDYWQKMDRAFALKVYHWAFLAQPAPFPEDLISASPVRYLDHALASWTSSRDLTAFSREALAHYRQNFSRPERVAATCEDYRAGASVDYEDDRADVEAGRKIAVPLLTLWGAAGIASSASTPLETWAKWAISVEGTGIDSGHFLPEEAPEETLSNMKTFFISAI